jgi:Zn-dependent protease
MPLPGPILARVDIHEPALWAVVIGWIMSVTLHEFAHNLAGYLGGDRSIRDEGRLTLNPFQYVDPFMTIILPVIFLILGGVPLPGGSTRVDRTRLRSRPWESAVSAAGPLANLILFAVLAIPLLPQFDWLPRPAEWKTVHKFVAAMCFLQLLSVLLNLIPVPGLDGYGIIEPYLPPHIQERLAAPHLRWMFMLGYFMVLWNTPAMNQIVIGMRSIMGDRLWLIGLHGFEQVFRSG